VEQGFREQRSVRLAEGRDRADELRSAHRNDGGDRAGDDGQEDRRYSGTEGSAPGAGECDLGPERSGEREQQAGGTGELLGETECVRGGECAEEEAIDAERHSRRGEREQDRARDQHSPSPHAAGDGSEEETGGAKHDGVRERRVVRREELAVRGRNAGVVL